MAFNPNDRVRVQNTRAWQVSFPSVERPNRGIVLKPNQIQRIPYIEVEAQAQTPGSFFYGQDGLGSFAAVRIVDDDVRAAVFGLALEESVQPQLTLDYVREMINISPNTAFKEELKKNIKSDPEKRMFARLAARAGLDEVTGGAGKKRFIEEYTGYPVLAPDEVDAEPAVVTTLSPAI